MTQASGIVYINMDVVHEFIRRYCIQADINPDLAHSYHRDAHNCTWCGVLVDGWIRVIIGLNQLDAENVIVWAILGDCSGTIGEMVGGLYLEKLLEGMPFNLSAVVLKLNKPMQKIMLKRGWQCTEKVFDDDELQQIWERPAKEVTN